MPHFYFNYTTSGVTILDDVGTAFPSIEAAYLDTCESALAIAFEKLKARQDPTADAFQILDERHNLVMEIPFSEVLRPGSAKQSSSTNQQTAVALENCLRQIVRGETLSGELRAEIAKARQLFGAIRASLLTSHPAQM